MIAAIAVKMKLEISKAIVKASQPVIYNYVKILTQTPKAVQ